MTNICYNSEWLVRVIKKKNNSIGRLRFYSRKSWIQRQSGMHTHIYMHAHTCTHTHIYMPVTSCECDFRQRHHQNVVACGNGRCISITCTFYKWSIMHIEGILNEEFHQDLSVVCVCVWGGGGGGGGGIVCMCVCACVCT